MDSGTDAYSMPDYRPPRGFAAWQAAWRGLPDNPIACYLLLADQRRQLRARRRTLSSYILLTALFGAVWLIFILGEMLIASNSRDFGWQTAAVASLGLLSVLYCLWLGAGVFAAVRDALLVLAPPTKLTTGLALDDALACSSLADEDIILGILRILAPPLWWRGLLGSGLCWTWVLVAQTEGLELWNRKAELLLVLLPVMIALMALTSALGAVAFLLFYLAISRLHSPLALSAGALLATLGQLAWVVLGPALALGGSVAHQELGSMSQPAALGICLAGFALCLLLFGLAGLSGRYSPLMRAASTVAGPWLLPLLLVLGIVVWQIFVDFHGVQGLEDEVGMLFLSFLEAWGSILPFNAFATPGVLLFSIQPEHPGQFIQLLRCPAGLILQAGLVAVLAWAARDAVRRRRTEGSVARG